MYNSLEVEFISRKNANYASNNETYIKRGNVRIKKIVLDLNDVTVGSKKVVFFEYEINPFYPKLESRRGVALKYVNSLPNTKRDNVQNSVGV